MKKTFAILFAVAAFGQTPPSPSFAQYLAARQVGAHQLLANIAGPIPRPNFGFEMEAIANAHLHFPCTPGALQFTAQQSKNLVDWGIGAAGVGYQTMWINIDPGEWISTTANCTGTNQAVFNNVVTYAQNTYGSNAVFAIKPSFSGTSIHMWQPTSGNGVGCNGGLGYQLDSQAITGGSHTGGTVTYNVASTSTVQVGQTVTVSSNTQSAVNGSWVVSAVSANVSITVTSTANVNPNANGTITNQTPQNLATCMTTAVSTLKLPPNTTSCPGVTACSCAAQTGCSPVAYWSEYMTPLYFMSSSEATSTQNSNLQITASCADWLSYNNTIATEVNTHSPNTLIGPAISRLFADVTCHNTMATAIGSNDIGCVSSCHPDIMGYDEYTDDLYNTSNGLGANQPQWVADQAAGIQTIIAENWRPGWNPGGQLQGDGGSYQGNGDCVWNTSGQVALSLGAMAIYFASQNMTAINHMSAWNGVRCTFCAIGAGNDCDHDQDSGYETVLATALGDSTHPAEHTPLFCLLQNIVKWVPAVQPGQPLGFDFNCRAN